jgi:uncharacterized DUF497 family protein
MSSTDEGKNDSPPGEPDFEWDEAKAEANLEKHGIDFVRAARIFQGPVFEAVNGRDYGGERRIRAIGEAGGLHLVVIYTWRGRIRRIISAWKAGRNDRKEYQARLAGGAEEDAGPDTA